MTVIERLNARELLPADLPFAPALATVDVSFISLTKILPAVARCLAPGGEVLAMVKPQFELGRERVGRGVVRDAGDRREAILAVAEAAAETRPAGARLRLLRAARPEGQPRDLRLVRRRRPAGRRPRRRDRRRRGGGPVKTAALITHSHPPAATEAVAVAVAVAREAGWRLVATADELAKHGDAAEGIEVVASDKPRPDLCLVLGGDGSILHALRRFARTGVPVFGVNFGTVGFLAAVERDEAEQGIRRALAGEIETIELPGPRGRRSRARPASASTTSPSPAARTTGSPSSATGSPARRSATSAATASSPPPRSARPATTSPTRGRSWPGG